MRSLGWLALAAALAGLAWWGYQQLRPCLDFKRGWDRLDPATQRFVLAALNARDVRVTVQ